MPAPAAAVDPVPGVVREDVVPLEVADLRASVRAVLARSFEAAVVLLAPVVVLLAPAVAARTQRPSRLTRSRITL